MRKAESWSSNIMEAIQNVLWALKSHRIEASLSVLRCPRCVMWRTRAYGVYVYVGNGIMLFIEQNVECV